MRKITLCFSLLLAATAAAQGNGDGSETPSQSFTPVDELTEGWYQLKVTSKDPTKKDDQTIDNYVSAGTNWIVATNDEYRQVSNSNINWYSLKYVDLYRDTDPVPYAASFIYVIPTGGNNYSVQGINGHYVNESCISSRTTVNNTITYNNDNTFTILHWNYFDAGKESPLVGRSNLTQHKYQFSSVNINEYDVYTVQISGAPESSEIGTDPQVTCTNEENKGISKVYNNGKFIFPAGTTNLSEDNFTADIVEEYSYTIQIDKEEHTITVTYKRKLAEYFQRIQQVFIDTKDQTDNHYGELGYPKEAPTTLESQINSIAQRLGLSTESTSKKVKALADVLQTETDTEVTDEELTALEADIQEWMDDIVLPEDGAVYTIKNVTSEDKARYVYYENGAIKCTTTAETAKGKNFFVVQNIEGDVKKLVAADGSGYYTGAAANNTIEDTGTPIYFDKGKGKKFGHLRLVVKNSDLQYVSLGTNVDNGNIAGYTGTTETAKSYLEVAHSTDFIFEEVTMNGEEGDEDGYKGFEASLAYGRNRDGQFGYYGTLNLPYAVTLPEDVKAYTINQEDNILKETELTLSNGNVLPAETPVVIKKIDTTTNGEADATNAAAENNDATLTIYLAPAPAEGATVNTEGNQLHGTLAATHVTDPAYIMVLTAGTGSEIMFYRLMQATGDDADADLVNANKAYFVPNGSLDVRELALTGGMATGIDAAQTATADAAGGTCYDLSGRRVTKPAAGIYIVGGKKIFVR